MGLAVSERQADERAASQRVRVGAPFTAEVGEEEEALAPGRDVRRRRDELVEGRRRRDRVAQPAEAAGGREHHGHQVPAIGDCVAEGMDAALGLDERLVRRREHHARGAEREHDRPRIEDARADRGGRLVAGARDNRRAGTKSRGRRGGGGDGSLTAGPSCVARQPGPRRCRARRRPRRTSPAGRDRTGAFRHRRPCPLRTRPSVGSAGSPWAAAACAIRAHDSGSWSRTHSTLGAVSPVTASLPVTSMSCCAPMVRRISSHSAAVRWSFHRIAGRMTAPAASSSTIPCIWPVSPIAATSAPLTPVVARTDRIAVVAPSHHSAGSCSLHSGRGASKPYSAVPMPRRPPTGRSGGPWSRSSRRRSRGSPSGVGSRPVRGPDPAVDLALEQLLPARLRVRVDPAGRDLVMEVGKGRLAIEDRPPEPTRPGRVARFPGSRQRPAPRPCRRQRGASARACRCP